MSVTKTYQNTKVQTGQEDYQNLKNAQQKFDELYANDESLESVMIDLESRIADAGAVDTVSINGGTRISPDGTKNVNLTINKASVGLGNVANVDTTNASNLTAGTLSEARVSTAIARINTTALENYYTKSQVDEMHNVFAGGTHYKSAISSTASLATGKTGDMYKASAKFTLGAVQVNIGDIIIAKSDSTSFDATKWDVIPSGDDGDVYMDGSGFSAGDQIAVSDGAGKKLKSSGRTIVSTVGSGSNDATLPTGKAVYDFVSGGYVPKETGKGLTSNDYTASEKSKLAGIAAGAQVNTVTGVKGESESGYRTGQINITKANVGLGNADNTSDLNKPISNAVQTALNAKQNKYGTNAFSAANWQSSTNTNYGNYMLNTGITGMVLAAFNSTGAKICIQVVKGATVVLYSDVAFAGSYLYLA